MAVSGESLSEFSGSTDVSSAEDFDHSCGPCLTTGQHIHVEAHGYCVDCTEHLCKTCLTCHQRTEATRNHQLFDKADLDKKGIPKTHSAVSTEKCHIHTDEVIEFFCLQHEELACHDCVALNHKSCDLDYIPDKYADIGDSEEFRRTTWLLSMKMAEVNYVMEKASNRRKEIDTYREDLIKGIDELQIINEDMQAEIDKKDSLNKQTVQGVLDSCTTISSDISKLQTKLQASKTTKQNGQLYIAIKQALTKLKADEIKKSEEELDKINLQYKSEPNPDLQALLPKQEGFGKPSLSTTPVTPWKKQVKLTDKGNINIKTLSDKNQCKITGCAVLSSNQLVMVDHYNKKLKVFDTQSNLIVAEKQLDSLPWDVTALPQDQIAVTLLKENEILIMTTDSSLSTVRTISVKGTCPDTYIFKDYLQCFEIFYHQDYLYTLQICSIWYEYTVVILDTEGTVYNTISLEHPQHDEELSPGSIVVSKDSRLMYISFPDCIVSITLQGKISAVCKNVMTPKGMALLDDGSLLVCCASAIHHISADMKQCQKFAHQLQDSRCICYDHHQQKVYIMGGWSYNKLKMFSLQYV